MSEQEALLEPAVAPPADDFQLEEKDIRRNMASLVLLETTFWTGSADINLALTRSWSF